MRSCSCTQRTQRRWRHAVYGDVYECAALTDLNFCVPQVRQLLQKAAGAEQSVRGAPIATDILALHQFQLLSCLPRVVQRNFARFQPLTDACAGEPSSSSYGTSQVFQHCCVYTRT